MKIWVRVDGKPIGAARPRVTRAKNGRSLTFTPDTNTKWTGEAVMELRKAWGKQPMYEGPVSMAVHAVHSRPDWLDKAEKKSSPFAGLRRVATKKPDIDNILKLVMDATVKAGVLKDDVQVVQTTMQTTYAVVGEQPGIEFSIQAVELYVLQIPGLAGCKDGMG